MQLNFEYSQYIGEGRYPAAFHAPSDFCQVIFVNDDERIQGMITQPTYGEWTDRIFGDPATLANDRAVHYFKTLYVPGVGLYGVWYDEIREQHRLGIFEWSKNLSPYLESGSLEFNLDDPIAKLSLEFRNPNQEVVAEEDEAIVSPGVGLQIFFRAGDSERYPLGRYFVHRSRMSVTAETTTVDAANMIGTLLQDQTFNEANEYPYAAFEVVLADLLTAAGVPEESQVIFDSANSIGMRFPFNMTFLDGIKALINAVSDGTLGGWQIRERMDGKIVLGPLLWEEHDQAGSYTFERGTEVTSRDVTRDNADAYSRVCVYTSTNKVYRDVEGHFTLPSQKTFFVELPEGTLLADIETQADALATRLAQVGVIETFVGVIRPHIQVGDEAVITNGSSQLLGVITSVSHEFGRSGYLTSFVVDSGGVVGAAQLRDYVQKISGKQPTQRDITRLY